MTRFISLGHTLTVDIFGGYHETISTNVAGPGGGTAMVRKPIIPYLKAEFRRDPISPAERVQALQKFRKILGPGYGNIFYMGDVGGQLTDPEADAEDTGGFYEPSDPSRRLAVFDTGKVGFDPASCHILAWNGRFEVPDPEAPDQLIKLQDIYDRELRKPGLGFGRDYVEITATRLDAPWPAYDNEQGAGKHDRIRAIVESTGIDPAYVIAYEQQKGERASKGVINHMNDILRAEEARKDEAARFVVAIPE